MTVNITSTNDKEQHIEELMRMLAWMEYCGNIGHYVDFRVNYDGDGIAHLRFNFLGSYQRKYEQIKNELINDYRQSNVEPKVFSFD